MKATRMASTIMISLSILVVALALTTEKVYGNKQHIDPGGNRASSSSERASRALNKVAQDAARCPSGPCDGCPWPPGNLFEETLCACKSGCPLVVGCKTEYDGMPGCRRRQEAIDECARRDSCRDHDALNRTAEVKVLVENGTTSALPSETASFPFGHNLTTESHNRTDERESSDVTVIIASVLTPIAMVALVSLLIWVYMRRRRNAKKSNAGNTSSLTGSNSDGTSFLQSVHVVPSDDRRIALPTVNGTVRYSAGEEVASRRRSACVDDVERLDCHGNAVTEAPEEHALLPCVLVEK